jgi:signal transduction histidine kinase
MLRLSREKEFLDTIFNSIHEGIIVIDKNLRIKYKNKAAVKLLGLPANTDRVRISQFLRDVDWKLLLLRDEKEWYRLSRQEIEVFYPDRRILHFYLVPSESRRSVATVILQDVTESRDHAEHRIETEKIQIVSLLAGGVAHEIGNPLNSLYLHLQLLQRQIANPSEELDRDDILGLLAIAKSEVERLDTIISQFLRAIRPTKPEMNSIDLKEVVVETLSFMSAEISNRSVEVIYHWPEFLPPISGDISQLKQAFFNIIRNALQAMPEGGIIEINCENSEDFVTLSFSDSGKGMSADEIGEIFTPFYTSKKEGTGLGLMIVERILRDHGAELAVNSRKAHGTDFVIRFPKGGRRMRLLPAPESGEASRLEPES